MRQFLIVFLFFDGEKLWYMEISTKLLAKTRIIA